MTAAGTIMRFVTVMHRKNVKNCIADPPVQVPDAASSIERTISLVPKIAC